MNTSNTFDFVNILFIIVPIIIGVIFIVTICMIFSPKLRSKLMGSQLKSLKYMTEQNKDTLADIGTTMGNVAVNVNKNILDQNEDTLTDIASKEADIESIRVEKYAKAIKKGFTDDTTTNDDTMKYCIKCGKKFVKPHSFVINVEKDNKSFFFDAKKI